MSLDGILVCGDLGFFPDLTNVDKATRMGTMPPGKRSLHQPAGDNMPRPENPESRREWVDVSSLRPGPFRRDGLSEEQSARLRRIHDRFAEIDGFTFDQRLDGFMRDVNPDQEIEVWERMTDAYERFSADRSLSPEARKEVYSLLLMRTMTSEADALERTERKALADDEATAVLREMR